jgi:Domain of unknown function (DUF6265)
VRRYQPIALALIAAAFLAGLPARAENICALPGPGSHLSSIAWLAGNWVQKGAAGIVRERWSGPYADTLLGVGVTTKGETLSSYEFVRIAKTQTGVSYFASPNAAPPTEFKAIELCASRAVFENKAHDFPQRVIYTKGANGTLNARIEGTLNGKAAGQDWSYTREQ